MNAAAPLFAKALALTTGSLLATANIAQPAPARPALPTVATANYTITYICAAGPGCGLGNGYQHTYSLSIDVHGSIKGLGTQTGYPQIQEKVSGALAHRAGSRPVSLNYLSTYDGIWFAGYTINETGTVDATSGALTGSATATMPGTSQMDASFSVKGVRTSLTFVHGHDGKNINPPITSEDNSAPSEDKAEPTDETTRSDD